MAYIIVHAVFDPQTCPAVCSILPPPSQAMVSAVSALVAAAVSTYLDKTSADPVLERLVSQTLTGEDTRRALEQVMGYVGKEVAQTLLTPAKGGPGGEPGVTSCLDRI